MSKEEARKQLEEALGRFAANLVRALDEHVPDSFFPLDMVALASEAIVIEAEVEHGESEGGIKITDVLMRTRPSLGFPYLTIVHSIEGHHRPPGRYRFIGVPLEEVEDEPNQSPNP